LIARRRRRFRHPDGESAMAYERNNLEESRGTILCIRCVTYYDDSIACQPAGLPTCTLLRYSISFSLRTLLERCERIRQDRFEFDVDSQPLLQQREIDSNSF